MLLLLQWLHVIELDEERFTLWFVWNEIVIELFEDAFIYIFLGWEQPAWFAKAGDQKGYVPSFKRTNWFHPVGRECNLVMSKVGIIDLTPFAKIDVKGKDAAKFLDCMLANKIPKVSNLFQINLHNFTLNYVQGSFIQNII